jgi:hypothetical protein
MLGDTFRSSRNTPEEVKKPMKKMFITGGLAVVLALLIVAAGALAETPAKPPPAPVAKPEARQLTTQVKTWTRS